MTIRASSPESIAGASTAKSFAKARIVEWPFQITNRVACRRGDMNATRAESAYSDATPTPIIGCDISMPIDRRPHEARACNASPRDYVRVRKSELECPQSKWIDKSQWTVTGVSVGIVPALKSDRITLEKAHPRRASS